MGNTTPNAGADLGRDKRQPSFRLPARPGKAGLRVADIGAHPGRAPLTLAHPLPTPVDAGLVRQKWRGR